MSDLARLAQQAVALQSKLDGFKSDLQRAIRDREMAEKSIAETTEALRGVWAQMKNYEPQPREGG